MDGFIYSIINSTNDKRYIGQTINFQNRKTTHLRDLRKGTHHSAKLQNAWNKYGEENFIFEVTTIKDTSFLELYQKEVDMIKLYDSYRNGYNMTIGGEGSARKHFSFREYSFIRIGNISFEGMYGKTAALFDVDDSVIADIVENQTYLDFLDEYNMLEEKEILSIKEDFINTFQIDINNPPRGYKQKVDYEILCNCLCIMTFYPRTGKTLEEIFKYSRGTMSALLRRKRYSSASQMFDSLSEQQRKEKADFYYDFYKVKQHFLERALKQGGCSTAYLLKPEDYYYAFYMKEKGVSYTIVANQLGVSPATVKDWFNGRSRQAECQQYNSFTENEKELYSKIKKTSI